ncbi:MAG: DNA mismatch repair protein MutS [Candidatus Tenebribacter burtonii]|jgi:DNA mismatch repair protein MutS|nr:DNA mismatch repair protein MutS [Candidatus Tenebribacter burtonii]
MKIKKITPMLKQFIAIKEQHPDKLLLFRMGDFYETFFEDAKIASKILGITLTARNKKVDNPIPLAGFPYHALNNYLDKLVKQGLKVVICEQIEDPKKAKGLVKRGITDIITPGSIIDEKLIDSIDHNYLSAIYIEQKSKIIGFAVIDASTGDFIFTELGKDELKNEILRLKPSEIVVQDDNIEEILTSFNIVYEPTITIFDSWHFDPAAAERVLLNHFGTTTLEGFGAQDKLFATTAAGAVLSYLKSLKNNDLKHIGKMQFYSIKNYMQLDEVSRRNLELIKSIRYNSSFGSLISILDETETPMGARKLRDWLLNPLLDKKKIELRLNAVQELKENFSLRDDIRNLFKTIGDLSRVLGKIGTKRMNPREAIALKNYLETASILSEILSNFENEFIHSLQLDIADYSNIIELINSTIMEEPPILITEGNIIKNEYNSDLDELREVSKNGKSWIARLEDEEKKKTGISSLKVNYNRVFGYYIEVTSRYKDKIPEYYIRKQTLVNSERYISPQLKEFEAKVLGAEERIKNLEYELFIEIREKLYKEIGPIQKYVEVVAIIDVLANLAQLAYKNNYVKPEFNDEGYIDIKQSRHPVIEKILKDEEFIPNDIQMNNINNQISLITGPNMAGKSTYLRQVGLLAIMAQMGSFIPVASADMPIFDKVFTRVGASDNLAMGQSTFLVEMIEAANILNSATPNSLILFDEIGRGTSTFDGLSLAWSIVEYIHNNSKISAKTLFATHYHELTELETILPRVKNFNIVVKEWNDKIIFLRKIERGSADQSYGIQVARLAGVPDKVIKRAKQILHNLEEHEISPQGLSSTAKKQLPNYHANQLDIFDAIIEKSEDKNEILETIRNLDVNKLTPIEAINKLSELKDKL